MEHNDCVQEFAIKQCDRKLSTSHIWRRLEDAGAASIAAALCAELSADATAIAFCTEAACTGPLFTERRTGTLLGLLMSAFSRVKAGMLASNTCPHKHIVSVCLYGSHSWDFIR